MFGFTLFPLYFASGVFLKLILEIGNVLSVFCLTT